MRARILNAILRRRSSEMLIGGAGMLATTLLLRLVLDWGDTSFWIAYVVWMPASFWSSRRLDARRRRDWQELGLPDPTAAVEDPPLVNSYPVTPAARRRAWIYLGLLLGTTAVVLPLALLGSGGSTGVAAVLVVAAAAMAALVVFTRGYRTGD